MTKWLTVVGMGEDGWAGLAPAACLAISRAEVIVGSKRLLSLLPPSKAEHLEWPQPFAAVINRLPPLRGRATVILATGDPMNFGVARKLMDVIPFIEMSIIPNISAFSLAAARMGWSLPDCDTLTLHGRETAHIEPFIQPDARLLVLTSDGKTTFDVCNRLRARGFGSSKITILENMGGPHERRTSFPAEAPDHGPFSDLNTLAIECHSGFDAIRYSRLAGLPDEAFQHDGQLTKREVRAATLAALQPAPDQVLWDIGAGCGSIAIEWMRATRGCMAVAFERDPGRLTMMAANAQSLGTPRLAIVEGEAPSSLKGSRSPDAIFIGGGLSTPDLFNRAWTALKPGGALVANVVTLEGESKLYALHNQYGGDIVRIEVSSLTKVGELRAMRPRMAVTQWRTRKPW